MGCAFKRWDWSSNCLGTWFRWALPIYPLGGAYLVLLGISNIRDGILFDKDQQGQELKRRFRISLPVIFAAFIPAKELKRFNQFLQKRELGGTHKPLSIGEKRRRGKGIRNFVHTSDSNLFGAIGHVDICYQGKVISYGSYDPFSERLFGTIGDGVLFKVDKEPYIELCKKKRVKRRCLATAYPLPKKRIRQ